MTKLPIVSFLGKAHGRKKTLFHLKMSTICFLKESESRVLLINLSAPHQNKQKNPLLKYLFQFKSTGRNYGVMPGSLVAQGKESACQCRRCGCNPWVGKSPWIRKWQPTPPVFLPSESRGWRSLAGYSPQTQKRIRHDLATKQQQWSYAAITRMLFTQSFLVWGLCFGRTLKRQSVSWKIFN